MDDESDWVLLSEIEHWAYCQRQWAIIQLEQHFSDNELTTRGHLVHQRVDTAGRERRHDRAVRWALDVWSDRLRLRGRCDRVVFDGDAVIPIEHKSGRRAMRAALLQVAAQAMCLEDMLNVEVRHGQLYLVASNELQDVDIDEMLRAEVEVAAQGVRTWRRHAGASLPAPANDHRCPPCSLRETCLPALVGSPNRIRGLNGATWWP